MVKHFFNITEQGTLTLAHVGTEESLIAEVTEQHNEVIKLTKEAIERSKEELSKLGDISLEVETKDEIEELAKYVHFKKQIFINEKSLEDLEGANISLDELSMFAVDNVGKTLTIDK